MGTVVAITRLKKPKHLLIRGAENGQQTQNNESNYFTTLTTGGKRGMTEGTHGCHEKTKLSYPACEGSPTTLGVVV
jgi:hypothetical protein